MVISLAAILIVLYFLLGVDDFLVDLFAFIFKAKPKSISRVDFENIKNLPEKKLSLMVASWKEADVIARMVSGNLNQIHYTNYKIYLGVYPNDILTVEQAFQMKLKYPSKIEVIVNSKDGPTSKGQMLNYMFGEIIRSESISGQYSDAFVIHDSEDIIHPYGFKIMNWKLLENDFVQIPVFSLPLEGKYLVGGTYADEFAEHHTKDMILRDKLGSYVPSAGVGTAISRELVLKYFKENSGEVLFSDCVTEDYVLGSFAKRYGFKSTFACYTYKNSQDENEFIATREFFPKKFDRSVRQRSRWIVGIAFQSARYLKWQGSFIDKLFFWRDRKSPYAYFVNLVGLLWAIPIGIDSVFFDENLTLTPLLQALLYINLFFMINRLFQRAKAATRLYGLRFAVLSPLRLIVANIINTLASYKAYTQFKASEKTGEAVQWIKTDHELPVGFGELIPADNISYIEPSTSLTMETKQDYI